MGEILESLLDKTGFESKEIDGLVMSGLTGTGGASMFWAQSTCRHARPRSRLLRAGAHRRLLGGGRRRASRRGDRRRHVRGRGLHVRRHPCARAQRPQRPQLSPRLDRPLWPAGPARRLRPAAARLRREIRRRPPGAGQARGDAAQPRHHERERLRRAARADHHRGLPQLAHDRRPDPAARLRDAGRRRRRPDRDQQEAREGKGPATSPSSRSAMPSAPTSSAARASST